MKYKIWDNALKRWAKNGYITQNGEVASSNPEHYSVEFGSELLDRNDKEIYSGDVLRGRKNNTYKVVFENASFVCYHVNSDYGRWGTLSRLFDSDMRDLLKHIEIIGNIHQNKDLLQ